MQYARDKNGTLEYPTYVEFVGVPNWRQNDRQLRKKHYLPLVGEAEEREGYTAHPKTWHVVTQSETHTEPRYEDPVTKEPYIEDVMEEDPVTHEIVKVGERRVARDTPITVDASYYQVDEWEYEPVPEPDPAPVVYSKYKIQLACQKRGLWEQVKGAIMAAGLQDSWSNIVDIASDNQELQDALPTIRGLFGSDVVDAVLAESVADE